MKTCSLSEAKSRLGKLADAALEGHPTVISRGGKLLILKAYEPRTLTNLILWLMKGSGANMSCLRTRCGKGFATEAESFLCG